MATVSASKSRVVSELIDFDMMAADVCHGSGVANCCYLGLCNLLFVLT